MCHPKALLLPEMDSSIKVNSHLNPEIFDRPCHGCWTAQLAAFELVHGRWREAETKEQKFQCQWRSRTKFCFRSLQATPKYKSYNELAPDKSRQVWKADNGVFLPGINGRKFSICHVRAPCRAYINPLNSLWIKKCFLLSWVQEKSATCLLMAMLLMRTSYILLGRLWRTPSSWVFLTPLINFEFRQLGLFKM